MTPRILLLALFITTGYLTASAQAQGPGATTSTAEPKTSTGQTKEQIRGAKKAERVAIRKKRAQCYDQAKKEKKTGPELASFLEACNKK